MDDHRLGINIADFYSKVVETTEEGILCIKPDGFIVFTNEAFCRLVGYERSALLGKKLTDLLSPESLSSFQSRKEKRLAGKLREQYEVVFINGKTGEPVYALGSASPIFGEQNELLFSMGMVTNITPLKIAQSELGKNIERLKSAQVVARLGFWEHHLQTGFWFSDGLSDILGVGGSERIIDPAKLHEEVHPEDLEEVQKYRERAYQYGEPYTLRYRVFRTPSELLHIQSTVEVEKDKDGRVIRLLGILQDITEQAQREKVIEEQRAKMIASSKLSALGEMAGGMAHEINSPLAAIRMRAEQGLEMLQEGRLDEELVRAAFEAIMQTTIKIGTIVKGLRHFSRYGDSDLFVSVSVHHVVESTLSFCREKFKNKGVPIEVGIADPSLAVECQQTQVSQVLINLLNNAFDAIENLDVRWVRIEIKASQDFVDVCIVDSGPGIPVKIAEKLFQPFFTTKEIGKGIGLGLSISKGLMESQKGLLFIDDQRPNTCFVMRLPKAKAEANFNAA